MPRETIIREEVAQESRDGLSGAPAHNGLQVGWNRIGWAQLSVVPPKHKSTGDWSIVDLDRGDINRLIRTLRKARDQAYGADA